VDPPAAARRDLPQLLGIDVQQRAGGVVLVADVAVPAAADRLASEPVEVAQVRNPGPAQHRPDGGGRHPEQGRQLTGADLLGNGGHPGQVLDLNRDGGPRPGPVALLRCQTTGQVGVPRGTLVLQRATASSVNATETR